MEGVGGPLLEPRDKIDAWNDERQNSDTKGEDDGSDGFVQGQAYLIFEFSSNLEKDRWACCLCFLTITEGRRVFLQSLSRVRLSKS